MLKVGSRIRLRHNHWARAHHEGMIVEMNRRGRYLVRFDDVGIGFDDGRYLWLDQVSLEEIK